MNKYFNISDQHISKPVKYAHDISNQRKININIITEINVFIIKENIEHINLSHEGLNDEIFINLMIYLFSHINKLIYIHIQNSEMTKKSLDFLHNFRKYSNTYYIDIKFKKEEINILLKPYIDNLNLKINKEEIGSHIYREYLTSHRNYIKHLPLDIEIDYKTYLTTKIIEDSYYMTNNKQLVKDYEIEFANKIIEIKEKNDLLNYPNNYNELINCINESNTSIINVENQIKRILVGYVSIKNSEEIKKTYSYTKLLELDIILIKLKNERRLMNDKDKEEIIKIINKSVEIYETKNEIFDEDPDIFYEKWEEQLNYPYTNTYEKVMELIDDNNLKTSIQETKIENLQKEILELKNMINNLKLNFHFHNINKV